MSRMGGKHRWMFVVEIAILFNWIFLKNSMCDESGSQSGSSEEKERECFQFVHNSEVVKYTETELCFNLQGGTAECGNGRDFKCSYKMDRTETKDIFHYSHSNVHYIIEDEYNLISNRCDFHCSPSDGKHCKGKKYKFTIDHNRHECSVSCMAKTPAPPTRTTAVSTKAPPTTTNKVSTSAPPKRTTAVSTSAPPTTTNKVSTNAPPKRTTAVSTSAPPKRTTAVSTTASTTGTKNCTKCLEHAVDIMKGLSSRAEKMCYSCTENISTGESKGVIRKLPRENQVDIYVDIRTSGDISIQNTQNTQVTDVSLSVHIPKEASEKAVKRNGTFAAIVLFPIVRQNDPDSAFVNNEMMGIEMGAEIANLSQTIDIQYRNVDKNGSIASCRSWNGKGEDPIWITDGCRTSDDNDGTITCHCSHLTFFAILLSPAPGNISVSDFTSLTYITSIGCGLSLTFLAVALVMHCLIRKSKSNQATDLMMNLFVAMFTLNLSFLVNESIADLGDFGACVTIAAVMHYAMLATFTWFFMQALHLYFSLRRLPAQVKHYMAKICVTGWAMPAVAVISFLALGKYDQMAIPTNDGNSAKMCWITDTVLHQGVNIGYYAVVFLFTLCVFIMTIREIAMIERAKVHSIGPVKALSLSILGLVFLLGITWAVAFFSYGPLLIPSYYIFTILNSFQGFFLFIYYYRSRNLTVGLDESVTNSSTSSTTHTVVASPPGQ